MLNVLKSMYLSMYYPVLLINLYKSFNKSDIMYFIVLFFARRYLAILKVCDVNLLDFAAVIFII